MEKILLRRFIASSVFLGVVLALLLSMLSSINKLEQDIELIKHALNITDEEILLQLDEEEIEIDNYYQLPMKRGINIGNALDSPKYEDWGVNIQHHYFDDIKNLGFDTVRLPVRFSDYTLDDGNDTLEPEFMQLVDSYIDHALGLGLIVVLDLHHFLEIMELPHENENKLYNIWKQLSIRYQDYPNELVFEILNEPHNNLEVNLVNSIFANTVEIIRETNPIRKIIIGPYFYNNINHLQDLILPNDRNIIVTFHYYEPNEVTFQGDPYHEGYEHLHNIIWRGADKQLEFLQDRFQTVADFADKYDVDVFLGEFGVTKEAPEQTRVEWTKAVVNEALSHGFSYCYWEYISGFGIYDSNNQLNNDLLDALTK